VTNETAGPRQDWLRQPLSCFLWWGLPLVIGALVGMLHLPFRTGAGVCSLLFVWMATGCILNARRCHRVHCYISGPVLLLGGLAAALAALGLLDLNPRGFANLVSAVLLLALLSFVPEIVWKRYS
jgi:hypothetical protein